MLPNIKSSASRQTRPIKVVQFGEGNFLRAFADYMIDVANEKGVYNGNIAVVKPIPMGSLDPFKAQDNLYTVSLRGRMGGETVNESRIVASIGKVLDAYADYAGYIALAELPSLEMVLSNTTEAGIAFVDSDKADDAPPSSFPGKLTQFLYRRYIHFDGAADKGLILMPVELIEENGKKLKQCVLQYIGLWQLGDGFRRWVEISCTFCSTLVDRIVTGYPRDEAPAICRELGYEDKLLAAAEPFGLWVIESERDISAQFPLDQAGMPVIFTDDQRPYRERKVRILNGAHTSTVLGAFLGGLDTVGECMAHPLVRRFMETVVEGEVIPTVKLPRDEVLDFAKAVFERFENPFVRHELLSIALNSVSKWKSRILPSLRDSLAATGALPPCLTFSFTALLAFYAQGELREGVWTGLRSGKSYPILDDAAVLAFFTESAGLPARELVMAFASRADFWGEDLTALPGFADTVTAQLEAVRSQGALAAMERVLEQK